MNIDKHELQDWVKSLRNTITSSGFGEISDDGIYWIIYEYGKLLKNKPSDLELVQKALSLEDVELTLNGGGSSTFVTNDYKESVRYFANNAELLTWAKQTIGVE